MSIGCTPGRSALHGCTAAQAAELFGAFSDTGRVCILAALPGGELNLRALASRLGVTESAVSHPLHGLRRMRLVRSRRDGQKVYYRIEDEHMLALFRQGIRHAVDG